MTVSSVLCGSRSKTSSSSTGSSTIYLLLLYLLGEGVVCAAPDYDLHQIVREYVGRTAITSPRLQSWTRCHRYTPFWDLLSLFIIPFNSEVSGSIFNNT